MYRVSMVCDKSIRVLWLECLLYAWQFSFYQILKISMYSGVSNDVPVRLSISDQFSHQYSLIRTSTFIFYEQLMILYFCKWPIFIRKCIFEPIILYQYVYLEQYVCLFWQNFSPVLLIGPVCLLGTLEYTISEEKVESCRLCVESV